MTSKIPLDPNATSAFILLLEVMSMSYQIQAFAQLTGVTVRTLRYYHQVGLLVPTVAENGYRTYTSADADRLQQILFYRNAGFSLKQIPALLAGDDNERLASLRKQRDELVKQSRQLSDLITQVDATIANQEGTHMTDSEKFTSFKTQAIQENDAAFGAEVDANWGAEARAEANAHFNGLDEATYSRAQAIERQLADAIKQTLNGNDESAQIAELHKEWLQIMAGNRYNAAYHRGLADMYEADERFADYYNQLVGDKRAAQVLIGAIRDHI